MTGYNKMESLINFFDSFDIPVLKYNNSNVLWLPCIHRFIRYDTDKYILYNKTFSTRDIEYYTELSILIDILKLIQQDKVKGENK